MIVGIGIDLLEVERMKNIVEKNPRFLQRIFTEKEIQYCLDKKNKYQHLAARFTAKEAFFKALGRRIGWTEVEVINQSTGKPELMIYSQEKMNFTRCHLSLSHLAEYALAMVTLEME